MKKTIEIIKLSQIHADPDQPRQEFDVVELKRLEKSITQQGILSPLAIERIGDNEYLLVDGERRYRCAIALKLDNVPAIIYDEMDEKQRIMTRFHLQEQHAGWSAFDKARAIGALQTSMDLTVKEIADLLGMVKKTVEDYLLLLSLTKRTLDTATKAKIPFSFLREIAHTIKFVGDVEKRKRLEEDLFEKIQKGVILRSAEIIKIRTALKDGGVKTLNKFLKSPKMTAKQLLDHVGLNDRLEHRRIINYASYLVNSMKKGAEQKTNHEMESGDDKILQDLIVMTEKYLEV